ncbi:response regulator [Gallaecimonas pentaromativorans]|uniref:Two-component system chemotaxis response regulator CheY n=1 Tax=Gallaecimonas pentaromativorans TaxID=584787 RepID=A0A3N1P8E8_9GAMM|nr:response regulator [Gallaecimonas pentaromativorans]ROQ24813.1 two-component system chemotaxis response regulator CheY [Gallaecimonas pentaromativorans]
MTRILAADDSASIREMVQFTLESAGFDVQCAEDGAKALELARVSQYDVVISDVNMPNLDGIGLTKALRALPGYQFTPILILTTESSAEKKAEGKGAGATGWIVKPFNPDTLLKTVNKVR